MAVNMTGQKCEDCSGSLEYDKVNKIWICPYCGKTYEREYRANKVQIDGLAGINENCRATLLEITRSSFDIAQKNLSECERLDPNYVGTIIVNCAYYLFKAAKSTKEECSALLGKLKYYSQKLKTDFVDVADDEVGFYDLIKNPEIYAVLAITFNSINVKERESFIWNYFDVENVLTPTLNRSILQILFKQSRYEEIDKMTDNIEFIEKRYTLNEILKQYPDGDDKKRIIEKLLQKEAFTARDQPLVENYLYSTKDNIFTKLLVMKYGFNIGMRLKINELLKDLLSKCEDEEQAVAVFDSLNSIKLNSDDMQLVMDFILSEKCPNASVVEVGLKYLKDSSSLYELPAQDIITFFDKMLYNCDESCEILNLMISLFKISGKSYDQLTSYFLLKYNVDKEHRFKIISIIFEQISSIPLTIMESYLYGKNLDGENKLLIIQKFFDLKLEKSYYNHFLNDYVMKNQDGDNSISIIKYLFSKELPCSSDALKKVVLSKMDFDKNFIDNIFSYDISVSTELIDEYILKCSDMSKFNNYLLQKLLDYRFVISSESIVKYIMQVSEEEIIKSDNAILMINNCPKLNFPNSMSISFLNDRIACNFAQAYLLTGKDCPSDKIKILKQLVSNKVKLNDVMIINGKKEKFKKYILDKKSVLPDEIDEICVEMGVYKLFF